MSKLKNYTFTIRGVVCDCGLSEEQLRCVLQNGLGDPEPHFDGYVCSIESVESVELEAVEEEE
jgi:hypothetical protein